MLGHVPRVIAGLSMAAVGGLTVKIPSGVTSLVRALAAVQQGLHRLDGLSGLDEVVGITKWLSKAREYIGLLLLKVTLPSLESQYNVIQLSISNVRGNLIFATHCCRLACSCDASEHCRATR